jgi:hypothetical protein
MNRRSFVNQHFRFSIPRLAAFTLLVLAGNSPALCDEIHGAAKAGD